MGVPFRIEFLKGMDEGVFVVNRSRQITLWNQAAEGITGFKDSEMLGKTCSKHNRCHVNEKGEALCDAQCPLKRALDTGRVQELDALLKSKAGELIPVNVKVIPYHNAQGFVQGAVELFVPDKTAGWQDKQQDLQKRLPYTDIETGMVNRSFLDSYYLRLIKDQRAHYDRGLVLVDVEQLSQFDNLKDRMKVFDMHVKISDILLKLTYNDVDMLAARWSPLSYVVLINNSHPLHLQSIVLQLENQIRNVLYERSAADIDLCFRLMSTLIATDEPLEKVVDILHMKSAKTYRARDIKQ
jgi:PAS domain S-box-containing protein